MAVNLKIQGNFLVISDADTASNVLRFPRNNARHLYTIDGGLDYFEFFPITYMEGIKYIQDQRKFLFTDIIDDRTGAAFTSTDELNDYLDRNLGYFFFKNVEELLKSPLGDQVVAPRTTIIELESVYGISDIRDKVTEVGSASVVNTPTDREYCLEVSGSSSEAALKSVEKGTYVAGKACQYGIGIRTENETVTGDTDIRWGAFNAANAMVFGLNSTGKYVEVLDSGTPNTIYQTNWNLDKLDGTGDSGLTLSYTTGNIFNIDFTWYGYGIILFVAIVKDFDNNTETRVPFHAYIVDGKTNIKVPNLTIGGSVTNGTATATERLYIGGRQFSVIGTYEPTYRATSEERISVNVPVSAVPVPIITFFEKVDYDHLTAIIEGFEVTTNNALVVYVIVNADLTVGGVPLVPADYVTPTFTKAKETAFNVNLTADAMTLTNANLLYRTLVAGGSGPATAVGTKDLRNLILTCPTDTNVTIAARATNQAATANFVFRLKEPW